MANWNIPIDPSDASQQFEVELSGTIYMLQLTWNTRGEFWSLTVCQQDGTPIVAGIRLVADWPGLATFSDPRLPLGTLYTMDTSGTGTDPGRDDLGVRVLLVYNDGQ